MVKSPKSKKPEQSGDESSESSLGIKYPRRTERRRKTRAKILEVAKEQFRDTGYSATTMQAIADAADVHVTTLFMHFKSKSDLALSLVALRIDALRNRASNARSQGSVFDFVEEESLELASNINADDSSGFTLWHALYTDQELAFASLEFEREQHAIIADYVAAEYGLDRMADYRSDIVASILLASAFLPHRKWATAPKPVNLAGEISKSFDMGRRAAQQILEFTA